MKALLDLPDEKLTLVAPPPRMLTRHNCDHVGMTPGEFMACLARARDAGVAVVREGKLVMVETQAFVDWLLRQRKALATPANDAEGSVTEADLDREFALQPQGRGKR